jgi:hypothetical protein
MKSRSASEWVKAYDSIHQELSVKGFKPKIQTLDNEASTALKNFFTVNNISYQLVPPHCHLRSAAEHSIRTFKEHFVAGLSSVDPSFPMHLWDRLFPQAEMKLNLLQTSRLHPQLSAAAHYHGLVDYNKTDFAPPGCKIIAHEKCIITGVKMYTSRQRTANASWILSNYYPTIIKCHSYHPPTGYLWQPKTLRTPSRILIQKFPSPASGMTP